MEAVSLCPRDADPTIGFSATGAAGLHSRSAHFRRDLAPSQKQQVLSWGGASVEGVGAKKANASTAYLLFHDGLLLLSFVVF